MMVDLDARIIFLDATRPEKIYIRENINRTQKTWIINKSESIIHYITSNIDTRVDDLQTIVLTF